MDALHSTLEGIVELVSSARSMPLSASCVVNREELLGMLDDLGRSLPETISQAQEILGDRAGVVDEGRQEAAKIIAAAREQQQRMIEQTEVYREASAEADRLLAEARESADAMRAEVEDYVDGKLANFEIVLTKTLAAVERGRQKLSGRHELEALGEAGNGLVEPADSFLGEPSEV